MKHNLVSLLVGCLTVIVFLLASCAPVPPARTQEKPTTPQTQQPTTQKPEQPVSTPGPETVKLKLTKIDGSVVEKTVEKPKYGGIFIEGAPAAPIFFDEVLGYQGQSWTQHYTHNDLVNGDWSRGPAGTNESSFLYVLHPPLSLLVGEIAESWEFPDKETIVWHIRKGVRFHNKPPANGREVTADDVVFSLKRMVETPGSYIAAAYGTFVKSITATDKSTVVVKCIPERMERVFRNLTYMVKIAPPEVIQKYGNMADWRNTCGTGPFMLTDYVTESSITFARNPNYWMKDPLHKDNTLPYLDGMKILIIPDVSTRMAALRTGKVDWLGGYNGAVNWEDGKSLISTSPELKYLEYYQGSASALFMRTDTKPFDDIKVRRALTMAINFREIASTLYGAKAEILSFPVGRIAEFADIYTPVEQMPDPVKELFSFNQEQAKKLLAEAGYPNGFKTDVVCLKDHVDLLSIVKAYWAKIGVDMELLVKERAAYTSMGGATKTYKQMYMSGVVAYQPEVMTCLQAANLQNWSIINDARINDGLMAIQAAWLDPVKQHKTIKDLVPYILEQAYLIQFPGGTQYTLWWPWVKGYQGEAMIGLMNNHDFENYIWIDQDLKQKMTGRR